MRLLEWVLVRYLPYKERDTLRAMSLVVTTFVALLSSMKRTIL
jgi:hypothetical protein